MTDDRPMITYLKDIKIFYFITLDRCLFKKKICLDGCTYKVLTYVEYRAVSGVFQNIEPPLLHPQRVCPPPATKAGGTLSPGGGGVNILEDARHWTGLLQFNPSTAVRMCSMCAMCIYQWERSGSHFLAV